MISEDQARTKILEAVQRLPPRKLPILEALDYFAAKDYLAHVPLPGFDNSAMDGYAVIASEASSGKRLRVVGEQRAGLNRRLQVSKGEAVRIFTGGPIPVGADAVVMQEDVTRDGEEIVLNVDVDPGEFVRRGGCDLSQGQKILGVGDRIGAATVGLLASQGFTEVSVRGEVRAAIISSGDELAEAGEQLQSGQIYDSNLVMLQSLTKLCGATVAFSRHCRDDNAALCSAFEAAAQNHILIVAGGVSVGEHDLVQSTLRSLGAKIDIWRVAIKPGKPFLFGRLGDCFVFGLPGNPVSAFVTFLQFVRPAILKMMGATGLDLPKVPAKLSRDVRNDGDRVHYLRGRITDGTFAPVGRQESHALFGLSQSDALLRVDVGESLRAGEMVVVQIWDSVSARGN
ncbi:MAG TPA: gephyrin-like molybdotransferase Glp [Chthoniobacterales bacterium]|nr:gephyrin-like molybdotransferase Glp [Chthoniobacterales bacterium]